MQSPQLQRPIGFRSATRVHGLRRKPCQEARHNCCRTRTLEQSYSRGSQAFWAPRRAANPLEVCCRARLEDQESLQQLADALEASLDAGRRKTRFQPFIAEVCPWTQLQAPQGYSLCKGSVCRLCRRLFCRAPVRNSAQ